MNIVMINGSPRKNGATSKILNEFAKELRVHNNVDVSIFHLSDLNMAFCKGCCSCYKTGTCFIDDDIKMLHEKIAEADGLVLGTPCYASNVSAQLKTLIDRGNFVFEQTLKDTYCAGIVTYENAEGGSAYQVLKKLFIFSGSKSADKIIVKIPFNTNPLSDKKIMQKIQHKAANFYKSIKKNKRNPMINTVLHFLVFNFGIKPFALKKGNAYLGILQHWEKRGIFDGNI